MKEASWSDCLEDNSAIQISTDKKRAVSLLETADDRITFLAKQINKNNANYVFEDYYSSVLEYMQAIISLDGFKVTNTICLGYYLRDVLKKEDLFILFDDCRYKRNAFVYYGKKMDFETAFDSREKTKILMKKLKKIIMEKLNES